MSGDQLASSFADSNHRPPTSEQTPTSAVFPSPVFETPKPGQGSVADAGGWTPRFAEDYSVFNSTPGNLRGTQGPFADFPGPATPTSRHKRLLSAETFAAEIATHVNHFSHNPNLPLPPVEPSRRLASSPNSVIVPQDYIADSDPLPSSDPSKQPQTSKKARKAGLRGAEPTQTATPPPTGHRGERKLADRLIMQNDQNFGQPDFTGVSQQQQHDIAALMAASGDMFGYPMTAPAAAPHTFWDPSMGMDFDFGASPSNVFQTTPVQSHRHTGSFDWNSEIPLFQDPSAPFPCSNPEPFHSIRRERTLAPRPLGSAAATTAASAAMSAALSAPLDDPFGIAAPANGVNPGLLFGNSQNTVIENPALIPVTQAGSAEATIFQARSRTPLGDDIRRSASVKDLMATKAPDRTLARSPVKPNPRPGMGRSVSDSRGKRTQTQHRPVLPKLAPAARPVSQASNGSNSDNGRPIARPTGRLSPMKSQSRLSSLASIPEAPLHPPRTRPSVRFTIDSRGRARAETTAVPTECDWERSMSHRRTSRDRSRTGELGFSDDDDSSTDDEPIIIPSRANSFNASFALPDPLRPVGSIFHASRRSISDRSMSSVGGHDGMGGSPHDGESEAETVMHERQDKIGDAASELPSPAKCGSTANVSISTREHVRGFTSALFVPIRRTCEEVGCEIWREAT
ncbi:hypothetical protein FZEAL_1971 [Fusarium zealandicum]|uniref:PHD finger domain protein n=1 Tax=Fusarium zealandicum TaxID=1053134 RepID=A0A8H4XP11_9HYPO|nr:hypothetical protein FZEAL_1971 [Fusarium zealandicum]